MPKTLFDHPHSYFGHRTRNTHTNLHILRVSQVTTLINTLLKSKSVLPAFPSATLILDNRKHHAPAPKHHHPTPSMGPPGQHQTPRDPASQSRYHWRPRSRYSTIGSRHHSIPGRISRQHSRRLRRPTPDISIGPHVR